jgi:two-component system OmpR family response regulator
MEPAPRVLIVDDDPEIRNLLSDYLERQGLIAHAVGDGGAMWRHLERHAVDLVVLDLMLPGENGLDLCRKLRTQSDLPLIMLTARGESTDRVVGLELGADDYVTKPFEPRELLARIRATLRRTGHGTERALAATGHRLVFAGWTLDLRARELTDPDGTRVPLSSGEYRLLEVFVQRPNRALSRDQLLELLQGREASPFDRSIDVMVSRLRRRLRDDPREAQLIKTVRGAGYLFTPRVAPRENL